MFATLRNASQRSATPRVALSCVTAIANGAVSRGDDGGEGGGFAYNIGVKYGIAHCNKQRSMNFELIVFKFLKCNEYVLVLMDNLYS